jgi:hypothetical protein
MSKKLDLNGLLSKYESISNSHSGTYCSQIKDYDYANYPNRDVDRNFYEEKQIVVGEETRYAPTGNFQMSKSECEQFLLRMKDELRNEERGIHSFTENAYKHLHERFQANHEKIKREIL